MARVSFTCNDAFLFGALGYCVIVVLINWDKYNECERPLNVFLLVDYITVMLFRTSHFICQYYSDSTPFRRRLTQFLKIGVAYPMFTAWTIVGTVWLNQSDGACLPEENQYYTFIIWLLLCYLWIALYLCITLVSYTFRSDNIGHGGELPGGFAFPLSLIQLNENRGLSEEHIQAIPTFPCPSSYSEDKCSICIERFAKDDMCKKLPKCPHFFHAECIDEWLQRKNDCPVCRTEVVIPQGGTRARIGTLTMRRVQSSGASGTHSSGAVDVDVNITVMAPLDGSSRSPVPSRSHNGRPAPLEFENGRFPADAGGLAMDDRGRHNSEGVAGMVPQLEPPPMDLTPAPLDLPTLSRAASASFSSTPSPPTHETMSAGAVRERHRSSLSTGAATAASAT